MLPLKGFQEIYDDMKAWLIANQNKLSDFNDGSVISSFLEAIAIEINRLYRYGNNGFRSYLLDIPYKVFNLQRKTGLKASGNVVFSRTTPTSESITIPVGTLVATATGIQFQTTQIGTIASGNTSSGNVPIQAMVDGSTGNVSAASITVIVFPIQGVDSVTNPNPTTGGLNEETDTEFQKRFMEFILGLGNISKYAFISKAKSINGIRSASVVEHIPPLSGVYHFTLYLDDGMGNISSQQIIQVQSLIDGDGSYTNPGIRPPGIQIRYLAPTKVPIDVTVSVTTEISLDKELLKAVLISEITQYLNSLIIGEDVILNKLTATIMAINGVYDISITQPTTNVLISDSQIARAGTIEVTVT